MATTYFMDGKKNLPGRIVQLVSKTGAYTVDFKDDVIGCDASGGDFIITLLAASDANGKIVYVKNTASTGQVTVDGNSSETIDGELTQLVDPYECLAIVSDGSNWHII